MVDSTHFTTAVIWELWNDQIQIFIDNVYCWLLYAFCTYILTYKPFADRKLWTSCCEPDNTCTSTSSPCLCNGIKSHRSDVQRCDAWKLVQKPTQCKRMTAFHKLFPVATIFTQALNLSTEIWHVNAHFSDLWIAHLYSGVSFGNVYKTKINLQELVTLHVINDAPFSCCSRLIWHWTCKNVQVVPVSRGLPNAEAMQALLAPYSFTSFDLALEEYERVAEMWSNTRFA